jgi:AcrR family transcriptional regulator
VQVLKDDVEHRIRAAAVRVFAKAGYEGATMAAIAREAGLSTGSTYRYYRSKDILFESVIDSMFVETLVRLMRRQVRAARGPVAFLSLELSRFVIDHRLKTVVLLGRAGGSSYAAIGDQLVQDRVARTIAQFRRTTPELSLRAPIRLAIEQIYRGWLSTLVRILDSTDDERQIREAMDAYAHFHDAGLAAVGRDAGATLGSEA